MKRTEMLNKIPYAVMATMTCVGLTGCGTQAEDVMKPLKNGNYADAIYKYNGADFSDKEKKEFKDQVKKYLNDIVEDYAEGKITYEEVQKAISVISDMQINKMDENIATASASVTRLYASKTAYEEGLSKFNEGKYELAIDSFSKVVEEDIYYEDAVIKQEEAKQIQYEMRKADMIAEVDKYIANEDYVSAFNVIESFIENNDVDDKALEKKYNEYIDKYVQKITDKVNTLKNNKDYVTALTTVRDAMEVVEVESLNVLCKELERQYVALIKEKAESLIEDKEYLLALQIIDNAKAVVENGDFTKLIERIEKEKPIYLADIKYQTSSGYALIKAGENVKDTLGNEYTPNGNLFEMSNTEDDWSGESVGSVEYYLGYSYDKFNLTIAVDDVSDNISSVFTIYGDNIALYKINLNRKTVPTDISIDVSNVNYLSIKMSGATDDGTVTAILSNGYFE